MVEAIRDDAGIGTGDIAQTSGLFVVWKSYQRRSEVLAPLLDAELLFIPHLFRSKYLRPFDYVLKFIVSTAKILRRRPKYVVVQAPPHYAALPAILTRVPYVIDAHNGVFQSEWRHYPLSTYVLRRAVGVIVHNAEILEQARRQHSAGTYYVIQDPLQTITPADEAQRNASQILFICSFKQDEPIDTILDVIQALPEYTFVITADPRILSNRQQKRLAGFRNLRLTGYLNTRAYHALMCSSAAAIALTRNEATQQSGACEALSSDTPLITSRSSLSEALFGDWAVLVENEPRSIITAIVTLKNEPLELSSFRDAWNEKIREGVRRLRKDVQQRR